MHVTLLQSIKADDNIALLFNAYMRGLSTVEIFSTPRENMADCNRKFEQDKAKRKRGKKAKLSIIESAERTYKLMVLSNSLGSIHHCLVGLRKTLQDFFDVYEGELLRYAIEHRIQMIDEYGSDEDEDWAEDGVDEQGKPKWKVTYKDDPESLSRYTLHNELGCFFGYGDDRDEYIGTSSPDAFRVWTTGVLRQSEFSFRKIFDVLGGGQEVTIYQVGLDGEMKPQSLADQIESEMNEDIRNDELAGWFEAVLTVCQQLAEMYRQMDPEAVHNYRLLLDKLNPLFTVTPRYEKRNPFGGLSSAA